MNTHGRWASSPAHKRTSVTSPVNSPKQTTEPTGTHGTPNHRANPPRPSALSAVLPGPKTAENTEAHRGSTALNFDPEPVDRDLENKGEN